MLHHQGLTNYSRESSGCLNAISVSWRQHLCEKFCDDFEVSQVSKILEFNFNVLAIIAAIGCQRLQHCSSYTTKLQHINGHDTL